ncbi:proton-conducting transporter membrane subunit [Haloplanus salinarum]|uniref:proton-conducting transporter transmembrane domain-containing protein n=1 Tax=Haloplanus salinarum TaxID=1912324 RepID=UPI00214AE245|nr:proton-conducting transporter membrane subunit [Haloplanus salinarum]
MTGQTETTVGALPTATNGNSRVPVALTRLVWLLWLASVGVLAGQLRGGEPWGLADLVIVDGLTAVMWVAATFFSGVVHSYSRRYMAGGRAVDRFFGRVFGFTLLVMTLVAADHLALFGAAWLAMGLVMADLIGHVEGWPQARAAGSLARRNFLASSGALAAALGTLWWHTGATTVSGLASTVGNASPAVLFLAAGALLLAAAIQSALVPFHTWLLSSMTAPTPASALMHAGFVNAGGVLLVRFAPVVTAEGAVMLGLVALGAASAILGKLLKTVRTDVKGKLGCSTVGQMGFMLMQAGLGFFGAAITHLVLHGCYKAYRFLGSGEGIERESPTKRTARGSTGAAGVAVIAGTALAGGVLFGTLTGKGMGADGGLLLTLLVVLTVMHAARELVADGSLPSAVRYGAVPAVALPAIAVYAAVYGLIEGLLAGLPAVGQPTALTPVHGLVAAAFVLAYLGVETEAYRHSRRLYVALLNATQPPTATQLTSTEEYDEY